MTKQEEVRNDIGQGVFGSKNCTKGPWEPENDEFEEFNLLDPVALVKKGYNPYLFRLSAVDWGLFITVTWKNEALRTETFKAETLRRNDLQDLMNAISRKYKIRHKNLAYFRTTEFSPTGQGHFHCVIARRSMFWLNLAEVADFIEKIWSKGTVKVCVAKKESDSSSWFVEYICKGNSFCNPKAEKFDFLSKGLLKLLSNSGEKSPV